MNDTPDSLKEGNTEIQLRNFYMRTMSQPIADKAKKALNDIQRAKRLLAKAEVALTEIKGFYSLEA